MKRRSILRRSLVVTAFFALGHAFHYLLLATGNRALAPEVFGLFYTSISLINVVLTPGVVLTLVFAQHFAGVVAARGEGAVGIELRRILERCLYWGGAAAVAVALALAVFGVVVGIDSFAVVLLVPAVSLAVFLFETIRAAFQGLLRFSWFSAAWVFWRALQYVLAAAGFYVLGTVWSGLAGILVATLVSSLLMLRFLRLPATCPNDGQASLDALKASPIIAFIVGYGLFTLLVNADTLLAYLVLTRADLGSYASSSILPKAIVTMTQPVGQIVLPVIAAQAAGAESVRMSVTKGVVAALGLGVAGWAVVTAGAPIACNGRLGLQFCEPSVLTMLAIAAVPLGVLRVLILASLATRARWHTLVPLIGLSVFGIIAVRWPLDPRHLASVYAVACWGVLACYVAVMGACSHVSRRAYARLRAEGA